MSIKIEIEVSEENEMNRAPYWMVACFDSKITMHNFYSYVKGPFFSRIEAQYWIANYADEDFSWYVMAPSAPHETKYSKALADKGRF